MHTYTVDTDDGDALIKGDGGQELTSSHAARLAALAALPDMAHDKLPNGDHRTFTSTVRDETGREIYAATLTLVGEWKVSPPPL